MCAYRSETEKIMTLPWSVLRWASKILPASTPPGRSGYVQVRRGCELVKKTSLAPSSTILSSPLAVVGLIGPSLHNHRRRSQLALSQSLRFFSSTMSSEEITHETIKGEFKRTKFLPRAAPLP